MNSSIVFKYFPGLDVVQQNQFEQLQELYTEWNSKINLISRKDISLLYPKHILHSLAIAKFITFNKNAKVMDVGTGGGFPAIPLAIVFPETSFIAVDSISKKINAVKDIANLIGLKNFEAVNARAESLNKKVDFVVSRATAPLTDLAVWTKKNISPLNNHSIKNGIICLKGGDLREELKRFRRVQSIPVTTLMAEEFFEEKYIVYLPVR